MKRRFLSQDFELDNFSIILLDHQSLKHAQKQTD